MNKIIVLICIVFMLSTACENPEFFELERPVQSPWQSLPEFERAALGAYNRLYAIGDWGNYYNIWVLYRNAVADDCEWATPGDKTWGWYRDTEFNKQWLDNDLFSNTYVAISSINDALQFVEDKGGDPYPNISQEDRNNNFNRLVGELHFLRGYSYFMNATIFVNAYVPGGANDAQQIPLRTTKSDSYEAASNSKIGTTQEIWEQILSDFQKAYDLLPERYIAGKMHTSYQAGRANKFAAASMLARTYFAMGNYVKAKEFANFVIEQNGGDYDLTEDPIEAFNKSVLGRGNEVIMYIPSYDLIMGRKNLYSGCYNHSIFAAPNAWTATHMDYVTIQRLGWMNNPKTDTTINLEARIDKRFTQLIYVREPANVPVAEQNPDKYYEVRSNLTWRTLVANKASRGPAGDNTNLPQIRLAEMYLTRSILRFKDGDKQGAANDLNVVRKRAFNAAVAGVSYELSDRFVTAANITEQMIGDERVIEMFMEGDRIDYLRGLKVNVPNNNPDRGVPASVPYTDKGFVWPIPVQETDLNNAYN